MKKLRILIVIILLLGLSAALGILACDQSAGKSGGSVFLPTASCRRDMPGAKFEELLKKRSHFLLTFY